VKAGAAIRSLPLLATPEPERLPKGLDALHHAWRGFWQRRRLGARDLLDEAARAEVHAEAFAALGDGALRAALVELRQTVRRCRGDLSIEVRVRALAALREAGWRAWRLRAFPVQLAGVVGLERGVLLEMATGEGKTLVAALAAALAGWRGRPVHVVTVNDYLARRDADHFARLAEWTGLSVAAVTGGMSPSERQVAYRADIVYTTSKELLADFLRDRLALGGASTAERLALREWAEGARVARVVVQRGLHTAIVDEADSVLIDEAVTPLIISRERPNEALREACQAAYRLSCDLEPGRDYHADRRHQRVDLTRRGEERLARLAEALPGLWRGADRRRELVEQALQAREFFARERQYIVQDGKVVIVDEFSGRLMPQRTWREGLHQAIEAREGLEVTSPSETVARMSFQRFFRLFPRLAGMTGTAREAAGELWQIYRLPVVAVPTHRPVCRTLGRERHFRRAEEKWGAIVAEIEAIHATGRPVLVGTRSIAASEDLDRRLRARGLFARVLNARRHEEEAAIITGAGARGAVTIATNMAGRGTDIRLGPGVAALGGLHVIATERHEAGRIDRQLYGRAGRQGDAGSARAFLSAEDELLRRFLPLPLRWGLSGLERLAPPFATMALGPAAALAQRLAQRRAARQRRHVLQHDQWLEDSLGFSGGQKI
jgi:preprotein translocase subunit SecA